MEHTGLQSAPPDAPALVRYLSGEASEQEEHTIEQWGRRHASHAEWLDRARQDWATAGLHGPHPWNVDAMRSRILHAIASLESATPERSATEDVSAPVVVESSLRSTSLFMASRFLPRPSQQHRLTYVLAGAAVAVSMIGWLAWTKAPHPAAHRQNWVYATENGQRATVTLPDSSTVLLNVASRLEVPVDYLSGHRTLRLRGEALFTVTHHDENPLTVLAGPSVTRVLGTRFVVRHYSGDTAARVVVQSGKVSVGSAVVTAHEETTVSATGVAPVRPADLTQLSFAAGTLTIRDTPLRDAIADLNRWYDVDLQVANANLASQRINGVFAVGSISNLASILELMLNVRAVRDGRILTLFPK